MTRAFAALTFATAAAFALPAQAQGDPEEGEKVFRKCMACHMVGEDAQARVGPALNGVVGSAVASDPDYAYSDALLQRRDEGAVWSEENLHAFLEGPREWAPGTKMAFAGLPDEEDRANVIAYLETFSEPTD